MIVKLRYNERGHKEKKHHWCYLFKQLNYFEHAREWGNICNNFHKLPMENIRW